jgi:hypothetical protein
MACGLPYWLCMSSNASNLSNAARPSAAVVISFPDQRGPERTRTRGFIIAGLFALVFYFLEYLVRSSLFVMVSQLATAFGTKALGVSSIPGVYYYTYSTISLVAGAALDHLGAKRSVSAGAMIFDPISLLTKCRGLA